MKIAFIGGRDIHALGGIENYMLNLATRLADLGHQPVVFCESDHNATEWLNGFQVIYLSGPKSNLLCKPWVGLKATWRVITKMRDVDFIHYNAWPPSLSAPLARLFGFHSLMQGHGLEWQRSKYSPRAQKIMRFMERITAHSNRNLIMCSEDQCRYFRQQYGRPSVCIPTAINLPENFVETDILKRFGILPGRFFLFLARLVQDKNPDFLIRAFIKARHEGYKLVIAGNNPAAPDYVKRLHELAAGCEDIIFTDAVYGDDKETLLRNAFAFCLPSTIEGLSISLLEAMSRRIPIIASNIPANREVLGADDALWVKPENVDDLAEAITQAVANPGQLKATIEPNYQRVAQEYTWPQVTRKYLAYLSSLLNK